MSHALFQSQLLQDQVAVITGGATGIGASITQHLAQLGATVVIASRKEENIKAAAAGFSKMLQVPVYGIACDIRDRDAVHNLVSKTLEQHGKIDLLVNNGGGQFFSAAQDIRPKGWDSVIATNLTGTWNLIRETANQWMLKNGGKIVNITMLTDRGFPGMAHSCAARAGVEGLTKSLAVEWANRNIKINCIQPGIIASSGMKNYPAGVAVAKSSQAEIPMKRLGTCDDIAHLVCFLASSAGEYITGQIWAVDGGRNLWGKTWPIPNPSKLPEVEIHQWPWDKR